MQPAHLIEPSAADSDFYTALRGRARGLVWGECAATPSGEEENADDAFLAQILLLVGQMPVLAAVSSGFGYAIAQVTANGDGIDGRPLAQSDAGRAVVGLLRVGRGLNGGLPDRSAATGWVEGTAETKALAEIARSPAWTEYTKLGRYNPKRAAAFENERATAIAWFEACAREGRDVYFCSHPLQGAHST